MAKMSKRPDLTAPKVEILDENGRIVGERTKSRVKWSGIFSEMLKALVAIYQAIRKKISDWWNNLAAVPPKLSEQEKKEKVMKETRDQTAFLLLMGAVVLFVNLPTLLKITFVFEAIAFIGYALMKRYGIENEEKIEKTEKKASKAVGNIFKAYLIWVLLLTVLAWAVKSGYLTSVTETFPWLESFSDWQISKINELVDFFKAHF